MPSERPGDAIDRSPDALFRNSDEARHWVRDADLRDTTLVLEDHFDGEHVATARIAGGDGRYRIAITDHESDGDSERVHYRDATEVAEMMGGWTVAGRASTDTDTVA